MCKNSRDMNMNEYKARRDEINESLGTSRTYKDITTKDVDIAIEILEEDISIFAIGTNVHEVEMWNESHDDETSFSFCWTCTSKDGEELVSIIDGITINGNIEDFKTDVLHTRYIEDDVWLYHTSVLREIVVIMREVFKLNLDEF